MKMFTRVFEWEQYTLYVYPDRQYSVFMKKTCGNAMQVCSGTIDQPDDLVVEILAEGTKTWDHADDVLNSDYVDVSCVLTIQ